MLATDALEFELYRFQTPQNSYEKTDSYTRITLDEVRKTNWSWWREEKEDAFKTKS